MARSRVAAGGGAAVLGGAVGFGLLQLLFGSDVINVDGVSYIDIARYYASGEWTAALNAYWSPLYSWILAAGMPVIPVDVRFGYTLVHVVNLVVLVFATLALLTLLRQLMAWRRGDHATEDAFLLRPAELTVGTLLILFWMILATPLYLATPDLLAAGLFLAASTLLVRQVAGATDRRLAVMTGVLLGLAYLAKTAMFAVAPAFPFALLLGARDRAARASAALLAAAFLAVALPWIVVLSGSQGRLTIGEAGTMNYGWVAGATTDRSRYGVEGIRQLSEDPPVYAFPLDARGTVPGWFDPVRWRHRPSVVPEPGRQLRALVSNTAAYLRLLWPPLLMLALLATARQARFAAPVRRREAFAIAFPALVALGLYALVWVERRYVAGPIALLLLLGLAVLGEAPRGGAVRRIVTIGALALLMLLPLRTPLLLRGAAHPSQAQIARDVDDIVPVRGAAVAVAGHGFDSFWAQLLDARVRFFVLGGADPAFWALAPEQRGHLFDELAAAGATAYVVPDVPPEVWTEGWQRIGESSHFVVDLRPFGARAGP